MDKYEGQFLGTNQGQSSLTINFIKICTTVPTPGLLHFAFLLQFSKKIRLKTLQSRRINRYKKSFKKP